jgi:hypothetical protein
MKKSYRFLFFFLAAIIVTGLAEGEIPSANLQEVSSDEIPSLIIGEWSMLDENGDLKAALFFKDASSYEMTEIHDDGTKVGRKGEYTLNLASEPYAVDLCLEKCGAPGSEWTTYFGIIRLLSNDEMEIRTSPTGTRSSAFDAADSDYTLVLTRKE